MTGPEFYFAYGSNLLIERLRRRVGEVRDARRATLSGYRLGFDKRGPGGEVHANITAESGALVRGVVYRFEPAQFAPLDVVEAGYDRVTVSVALETGESVTAQTYVAIGASVAPEGWLDPEYLRTIVDGAREHGLPEVYVRGIETAGRERVRPAAAKARGGQ